MSLRLLLWLSYLPVLIGFILTSITYFQDNCHKTRYVYVTIIVGVCGGLWDAEGGFSAFYCSRRPFLGPYVSFTQWAIWTLLMDVFRGKEEECDTRWVVGVLGVVGVIVGVVVVPSMAMVMSMYVYPPVHVYPLEYPT
jgi:hypothetical protein